MVLTMDRREAIKTAAALAFASRANPGVITPPPQSAVRYTRREDYKGPPNGTEKPQMLPLPPQPLVKRTKWRIVDQMIEEHGDGET